MRRIRCALAALLMVSSVFLSGCWNYREIESLSLVAGIAIDKGENGYRYHLTFEILDFSNGDVKSGTTKPQLLETDGDTVFDAVRNAVKKSERKLYFSECKVVVISQSLAREGISPLLDWLLRDAEPRVTLSLIVSKESTAREILSQKPVTDQIVSSEISKTLTEDSLHLSETPLVKLYQANNMLNEQGISLYLPAIDVAASKSGNTLELDGTAVFKEDKLIGYLSGDESKDLLFIENKIKGGLLLVSPDSRSPDITLEILESHTQVTPLISGGRIAINISVKTKAALAEKENSRDYDTEEGISTLETVAEKELESRIKSTAAKVQAEYDSDIFGFGKSVYDRYPVFWDTVKAKWDKLFPSLPIHVTAEVEIANTANTKAAGKDGD